MGKDDLTDAERREFKDRLGFDPQELADETHPSLVREILQSYYAGQRRKDILDSVSDEEIERRFRVRDDEWPNHWIEAMKMTILGIKPYAVPCRRCGGTGDEVRSPQGIIRCRDCGGSGWLS